MFRKFCTLVGILLCSLVGTQQLRGADELRQFDVDLGSLGGMAEDHMNLIKPQLNLLQERGYIKEYLAYSYIDIIGNERVSLCITPNDRFRVEDIDSVTSKLFYLFNFDSRSSDRMHCLLNQRDGFFLLDSWEVKTDIEDMEFSSIKIKPIDVSDFPFLMQTFLPYLEKNVSEDLIEEYSVYSYAGGGMRSDIALCIIPKNAEATGIIFETLSRFGETNSIHSSVETDSPDQLDCGFGNLNMASRWREISFDLYFNNYFPQIDI